MTDSTKVPGNSLPTVQTPTKILTPAEISAHLLTLPTMEETATDEVDHVMLYGEPGTGKTLQAGLLSEFYNILWFDGDKGLTTLKNNLPPELMQRIRPIKIIDNTATPFMVSTMLKVITGRQVSVCLEHGAIKENCTICRGDNARFAIIALNQLGRDWIAVMDSQTQMVASAMAACHYKINPKAQGKDVDDFWRGGGDDVFAYWGGLKNIMDKFGNYMKDLQCQFVTISHEAMTEMSDETTKSIVPVAGSDNTNKSFAKFYGTQIHAQKMNGKIIFQSSPTESGRIQAKSRANVIINKEVTPALLHVFRPKEAAKLLEGSFTEWWFKEGWKHPKERTLPQPKPKDILLP